FKANRGPAVKTGKASIAGMEKHPQNHMAAFAAILTVTIGLAGCKTTGTDASGAEALSGQATAEKSARSARSETSSSSDYVDPALVSASSIAGEEYNAPQEDASSLAGVVTQPTGIRAGNSSIFSNAAPPTPGGSDIYAPPSGRIDARTGSMFTAPAATSTPAAGNCGTDADGYSLSC